MVAGKKYVGLRVDIWSCGVILFAMICGYLPFEDPNTATLYKKILAGEYSVPKFISKEAKDLLKCILTIDPEKRFTIDQIRRHVWMLQVKPEYQIGIIVGCDSIPVNMDIVNQLEKYNYNLEYSIKCIENNKHNHVTTTYYLLLKKHTIQGKKKQSEQPQEQSSNFLTPKPPEGHAQKVSLNIKKPESPAPTQSLQLKSNPHHQKHRKFITDKASNANNELKIISDTGGSSSKEQNIQVQTQEVNQPKIQIKQLPIDLTDFGESSTTRRENNQDQASTRTAGEFIRKIPRLSIQGKDIENQDKSSYNRPSRRYHSVQKTPQNQQAEQKIPRPPSSNQKQSITPSNASNGARTFRARAYIKTSDKQNAMKKFKFPQNQESPSTSARSGSGNSQAANKLIIQQFRKILDTKKKAQ